MHTRYRGENVIEGNTKVGDATSAPVAVGQKVENNREKGSENMGTKELNNIGENDIRTGDSNVSTVSITDAIGTRIMEVGHKAPDMVAKANDTVAGIQQGRAVVLPVGEPRDDSRVIPPEAVVTPSVATANTTYRTIAAPHRTSPITPVVAIGSHNETQSQAKAPAETPKMT